jgi:hypothetical protein
MSCIHKKSGKRDDDVLLFEKPGDMVKTQKADERIDRFD